MSDHTYAVAMHCPHAMVPDLLVRVFIHDAKGELTFFDAQTDVWGHSDAICLFIPFLDTWTLDTLRMIFLELSAYVPADPDAEVAVTLERRKRRGRQGKSGPLPDALTDVRLSVKARGWRAEISTKPERDHRKTGEPSRVGWQADW